MTVVAAIGLALAAAAGGDTGNAYDPQLDGLKQLEAASAAARADGRRILVIVGGNWCTWCRALDGLLASNQQISAELKSHWVVVHINYSKENKNLPAMERLGNPHELGFPVLVVLSPELKVLHTQESGSLETPDKTKPGHDPARVLEFLRSEFK
jgi:thioredoxin-related protein